MNLLIMQVLCRLSYGGPNVAGRTRTSNTLRLQLFCRLNYSSTLPPAPAMLEDNPAGLIRARGVRVMG